MNAPPDLGPEFRSWLRDVPSPPRDLEQRTLEQSRRTPQRQRRLWFLPGRKSVARADDRAGHGRSATPFTNTLRGGTTTMLSPTKLIAAAAVAALGGALLLAGSFTTQEPAAPVAPAAGEPGVVTPIEGKMLVLGQQRAGDVGEWAGGSASLDEWWTSEYSVSDERLNGIARSRHNRNVITPGAYAGTRMITVRIDNDGGSWVGTGHAYSGPHTSIHYQIVLEGQGGYDGLHAIIAVDNEVASAPFEVTGAIISGGLPEMPEAVPEQAEPDA